jgi:poly-gamma-glutamate synthesis protein (capsule biosynthesis protein)
MGAGAALVLATTACGPLAHVVDEGTTPKKQPFTIAFGGDVHFEGQIRTRLDADPASVFGPIKATLSSADLAVVNLETAVTTGGTPAAKQFTFRAPPTAFTALKAAGVDVATMANNHGMDYGETGLRDSLAAAGKAGFPVVGIGANATEAFRPLMATVKGNKVAVIGATQVLDDNLIEAWTSTDTKAGLASAKDVPRLVRAVQAARRTADVVIVDLHWGRELSGCPTQNQTQLATQLADAGADAIIGSHAHVLLGGGYLKGAYVHYGLGNFVFYNSSGQTAQSGVLTLTFRARNVTNSHWTPALIQDGRPQPLTGTPDEQPARARWEALRGCTGLKATPPATTSAPA